MRDPEVIEGQSTIDDVLRLPDVPGKVHGIVGLDPIRIQCDGCGFVYTGTQGKDGLAVILCGIKFNPMRYGRGDQRRMCADCRKTEWSTT